MAKGGKKTKGGKPKERQERRFLPLPTTSPAIAKAVGGLGAALLGAGTWAEFGHGWTGSELPPYSFAPGLLAAGAIVFGAGVWLGTSGEAAMRVGAGGIGLESGKSVTRIPWYGVERIVWEPERAILSVNGNDEAGVEQRLALSPKVHRGAVGWIVKEGRARIPDRVDVPDEAEGLPEAQPSDGELLVMDAVQVVGRRCAATDRIIAYEPDARVCPRCELVYFKQSVPETCECGASLASLKPAATESAAESKEA
jgi:hypothetical protein